MAELTEAEPFVRLVGWVCIEVLLSDKVTSQLVSTYLVEYVGMVLLLGRSRSFSHKSLTCLIIYECFDSQECG